MSEEIKKTGTAIEVWKGQAKKTPGGLTKDNLMKNKRGKIVSKKKYEAGLRAYEQNKDKLKQFKKKEIKEEKEEEKKEKKE